MSTPEDIRIATAIAKAEAQVQADIHDYVTNCIPDAGEVLCRCPLFKAGKAISKYATVADEEHPDVETSWKEVVVTSNWSVKLDVRLVPGNKEKNKPGKTKILTEWISPLTSIVSVVPHQPASEADKERGAEFCVLALLNKDIKAEKEKEGAVNYRDDALRYLAPHHAALAKESAANRPEATQKEMDAIEQAHLDHLTKDLKFPSLRCRAYVVPEALGGAATRDKWVETYRTAVFNSWKTRLMKNVIGPEKLDITCVRYAEVTFSSSSEKEQQQQNGKQLCAVIALENKACVMVPVLRGETLTCTARPLAFGLSIPTPFSVDRVDPLSPFKVQISRGVEVSASLEFFTNAHADAFYRCTEQDVETMVMSFSI